MLPHDKISESKKYESLKILQNRLGEKNGIFQKKVGSFHQSVLEKRSRFENGSSHTAAISITYVASKKLKIMFFRENNFLMGPELWEKI